MDKKKVLIITYYWPPAGGPGVQRWLKFVKYLPEFDLEPVVYIPENPNYPITDPSLKAEVSQELILLKQPIKEPYKWAGLFSKKAASTISKGIIPSQKKQSIIQKLLIYIRGNFFIPDARIGWVKPSVLFLSDYLVNNQIETIITTGPPHSVHLIGLKLKERLGVTWLADFRDPWTTIGYHKKLKLSKASKKKHKALEKEVLNYADNIIVTSHVTKMEFESITETPITVITNGYDLETVARVPLDTEFSIAHIGSLLSERNPDILWRAVRDLIEELPGFKDDFQLYFIGSVSEQVVESIEKYNLINYVSNVGYVSHKEAITFQQKSQVLLLIEIDSEDTRCIIPGKLFEYMVSHRPIVSIGPKGSDVETIIKETQTGDYFYYGDYEALKATIAAHYGAYKGSALQTHPVGLEAYSRKNLTRQLVELIAHR